MRFRAAAASCLVVLAAAAAQADDYPAKPIRMVVPLDAGSSADGIARIVLPAVSQILGQQIIIDNEGGAASIPGTARTAHAKADGYTLLFGTVGTHASNPNMFVRLPYDPEKDFVAVARVAGQSLILAVPSAGKAGSAADVVAAGRSGRTLSYASAGIGTSAHLAAELLKLRTGVALKHVPYKGGPQPVIDLMRGDVDMMFYSYLSFLPGLQQGKLRLLAVAGAERSAFLPDLPTLRELGYDVVITAWYGIYAPAGTPSAAVSRVADAVGKALQDPAIVKTLNGTGTDVFPSRSPADFAAFTTAERERYRVLIEAAGIPKT